ncbi:hypothetical protein FQN57_002225 [Myotisia sp. PD_48]|nr:hypothetical protein FQN57_002225 [Myotisia sp. PD_48]
MFSEETFELCLRILEAEDEGEEEKVEKLEAFLRERESLTDGALENAVLDVLWRHRNSTLPETSPPPLRHTVIRRPSPAPWQMGRSSTPLSSPSNSGSSPVTTTWFPVPRGGFPRAPRSLTASPFTSPRPSPRLALVQPIPHSPNLNSYSFSDRTPAPDIYGDYGSDAVDWLVNEDARSTTSSTGLSAAAPEWIAPPDMGPYDILRSVLGEQKTNEEIELALETNGYDLGATIASLTEQRETDSSPSSNNNSQLLAEKSAAIDPTRPLTPSNPARSPIVCKYWLSTGQCLRADCRFSHDLSGHVCKYWLIGNCLAGESCLFSHDPSTLISNISINNDNLGSVGYGGNAQQMYQLQDNYEAFPALQPATPEQWQNSYQTKNQMQYATSGNSQIRPNSSPNIRQKNILQSSRPQSRPTSRHHNRDSNSSVPPVDDPEAFPTLAALSARGSGKKHHNKRANYNRDGIKSRETSSGSLADLIRLSPSSRRGGAQQKMNRLSVGSSREVSGATSSGIPSPKHIPWLEAGMEWNQPYLKYRFDAITHGNVRNKFLQSAAQAWNRNDARAAKALSLRGQAENDAMRRCHREAARLLYEEGRKHISDNDDELYVDLHGLVPTEAIAYLENILKENIRFDHHILYTITGSGHHSKNGKDKVGRAVKSWLTENSYTFRDFTVPGERAGFVAFVIGIDSATLSDSKNMSSSSNANNGQTHTEAMNNKTIDDKRTDDDTENNPSLPKPSTLSSGPVLEMGKIQLLKREDSASKA